MSSYSICYKKFKREPHPPPIGSTFLFVGAGDNITKLGREKILQNIFIGIQHDFNQLLHEVSLPQNSTEWVYNALIYKVVTGMLNLLDSLARFCEDFYRQNSINDPPARLIYFQHYGLEHESLQPMKYFQRKLSELVFNHGNLYELGNQLKHEIPWVGRLVQNERKKSIDIYDNEDNALVYGMIHGAYNILTEMMQELERLGSL